ncbi:hypothetical protein SeMB42_g03057 [Synchytrium endobioticum]|uniref:RRM domain-containing protein n=1 Tax=Synchytrium endobioticum TaxID=286115 RepID=A0A507DFZ9_9FUNG|nr:hypothetical protein SeMB42_g03057 [Synchytrium endobioticum]TPX50484.1 hypothetical protein SeLEV6574_g00874 [Synchytrium endobioticum]
MADTPQPPAPPSRAESNGAHSHKHHPDSDGRKIDRNAISLHVKGLTENIRGDDLRSAFSRYGVVKDVYVPRDYYTGRPRGFAFVQYENPEDTEMAYNKIEYITVAGAKLTVQIAAGDRKAPSQMRAQERGGSSRDYDRHDRRRGGDYRPRRYDDDDRRDRYDRRDDYYDSRRRDYGSRRYDDYDRSYRGRDRDYYDDRERDRGRDRDRDGERNREYSPAHSTKNKTPPSRARSPSPK